jgi:hypothetical protein
MLIQFLKLIKNKYTITSITSITCLIIYFKYKLSNDVKQIQNQKKRIDQINSLSIGGAGWTLFYYFGVIKALNYLYPDKLKEITYSGASAGSWIAVSLAIGIDTNIMLLEWKNYSLNQRMKSSFFERIYTYDSCKNYFDKYIKNNTTPDILQRVAISTTQLNYLPFNNLKKTIRNEKHLFESLIRSTYIPLIMGNTFFSCSKRYLDGCISNGQPLFDINNKNNTLTINTRYMSDADIKPSVSIPLYWTFHPISEKNMDFLYKLGYDDTINYFK